MERIPSVKNRRYYLRRRLASEGTVSLGITVSRRVYVRRAA